MLLFGDPNSLLHCLALVWTRFDTEADWQDETSGTEAIAGELVTARGNAAEVFAAANSARNDIPKRLEISAERENSLAFGLIGNDGRGYRGFREKKMFHGR